MRTFSDNRPGIIPEIWKEQVDKKGKLYMSDTTLEETNDQVLNIWLLQHGFYIQHLFNGAYIRAVIN